jgi:protocatechuate 3,4-dioxygenase beta subunit
VLPLQIGAVYYEDASGADEAGDVFEVTFSGGAPGTQLAQLAIQTDKTGDGLTIGDVFFDTNPGGLGAFQAVPLQIVEQTGIDSLSASVTDGGTLLLWSFSGFDPGDRLIFSIDVDEEGFLGANAVAEGNELEGSELSATFVAPHHFDAVGNDIFIDHYQQKLDGSGLVLPSDDYVPPGPIPTPVRTAAAIFSLTQNPLPTTIAGTVFEDLNLDNARDPGEPGLPGVELTLMELQGTQYVASTQTAITDAGGQYQFNNLPPGTYQVVETQPKGFFSVGATAGSVNQVQRGVVSSADVISAVALLGGEDSIDNDFAEATPVDLSGNVYHDADNDGTFDPGETGIGGVTVRVQYLPSLGPAPPPIELTTAPDGSWSVDGLTPGDYYVDEVQPAGYFDGLDTAGTVGGTAHNPGDLIDGIRLSSGQSGQQYNFGELVPSSISGRVIADVNGNCLYDPGETLLAGVTVLLRDPSGTVLATTQTDAQGQYAFTELMPGTYTVEEIQPAGYYDGDDHVGSVGGALLPSDSIVDIELAWGTAAVGYDFCELEPASIGGFVYVDENNDGQRNSGEPGIANVQLTLLDGNGQPAATTTTDSTGFYRFENLPPARVYGVAETQPADFRDGLDQPGTAGGVAHNPGDLITGAVLWPGTHATNYNFGELRPAIPPPYWPEYPPQPFLPPPSSPPPLIPPSVAPVPPSLPSLISPARDLILPKYGGGWIGSGAHNWYTWHLSVVNGGRPRRDSDAEGFAPVAEIHNAAFLPAPWMDVDVNDSQWILADGAGRSAQQFQFGLTGGTPVAGDWDGDGAAEIGVFLDGLWFLDLNGNGTWDDGDLWVRLGNVADTPVVGDWDGDGKADLGVFGPAWPGDGRAVAAEPGLPDIANAPTGRFKNIPPEPTEATVGWRTMKRTSRGNLRADLVDHVFEYGHQGDVAVTGDFNGDGVANIGIFRHGSWFLDADGDGRWSSADVHIERFGTEGDLPVVGDFNGDGIDDLGVYRAGTWLLDTDGDRALTARDKVFRLGGPQDKPVVGDFNGDGIDQVAIYRDGVSAPDAQAENASPSGTQELASSRPRTESR